MSRLITLLTALMALTAAGGLYQLKHTVEQRRDGIEALAERIAEDGEAIRVLEAEWAYLASPQVIQDRALRYLRLKPIAPHQMASSLAVLPFRTGDKMLTGAGSDGRVLPRPRSKPRAPERTIAIAQRGGGHLAAIGGTPAKRAERPQAADDFHVRMARTLKRLEEGVR